MTPSWTTLQKHCCFHVFVLIFKTSSKILKICLAPFAVQRARQLLPQANVANPEVFTIFAQCLDRGPDHIRCCAMKAAVVSNSPKTAIHTSWCNFHGYHLIEEKVIPATKSFSWIGCGDLEDAWNINNPKPFNAFAIGTSST